ncbi:MAG: hypothetical protein V3W11_12465 [bacterium]
MTLFDAKKKRDLRRGQTRRELDKRFDDIRREMAKDCSPLPPGEREERLARAREDVLYFGRVYLPHYFVEESASFHRELVKLLDVRERPVVVGAPRGHAKSTIVALAYPLHAILFRLRRYVVQVSETEDQAADNVEFIKLELEENERIRQDFGDLRREGSWGDGDFTTTSGIRVLARGRRQRIRSARHRQYRPDLIVVDDIESDESVRNPRTIDKVYKWLRGELYGAAEYDCSFFVIGNLLARRSVLGHLLFDDELDGVVERRLYRAIDDETGEPLWPAKWPLDKLADKRAFMGTVLFAKEFLLNPQDPEGAFQEEWFERGYYHEDEIAGRDLIKATFCDPSVEANATSNDKAIVTVGLDRQNMVYYVLHAYVKRASIDAMLRASWSIYDDYRPSTFGLESNGFQAVLARDYDERAKERGYYLPLKLVDHHTNKESRIIRLSGPVERGKLRFRRGHSDQDKVIEQLIYLAEPSVNDDGPDALEGAMALLEGGLYEHVPVEYVGGAGDSGPVEVEPWEE